MGALIIEEILSFDELSQMLLKADSDEPSEEEDTELVDSGNAVKVRWTVNRVYVRGEPFALIALGFFRPFFSSSMRTSPGNGFPAQAPARSGRSRSSEIPD